jgi:3-oxoacyl-[acyl-carrier protein] reductase
MEDGDALWTQAREFGSIQGLVNNAGIYRPHSVTEPSDAVFSALVHSLIGTNFLAPLALTRRACQDFQDGGRVVQVASRVGLKGEAGACLYSASKAALLNLVKALAVEHAAQGIHHFAIAPGWVDTAMARDGMEDRIPEVLASIPMGRMASPEDCASAVNWLLSGEADYMSGLIIDINGASYMR